MRTINRRLAGSGLTLVALRTEKPAQRSRS
jgi:hypothetical protein